MTLLYMQSILEAHLPQIQALDSNATVGYRSSAASGISKAHDPNLSGPINPNSFDVDGFIESDYLANSDVFTNRRREASKIAGMADIEASIDRELRKVLPDNDFKGENFGFRIFKTHELGDMARKGDVQVKVNSH